MWRNDKIGRLVLIGTVLGTMLFTGCGKPPAGGPPKRPMPEVGVITVTSAPVNLATELPGRTSPHLIAEVRPQVNGIIKERLFTEGSDVKAGQVLYRIDPAPYQAVVDSAQAALARAKAGVVTAKAALSRAEANLTPLTLKAERYNGLVSSKAVSSQDADDAAAAESKGKADVESAKAALAGAEAEVGVTEAAIETARINLAYTKVKAPISGRIGKSQVTTGALVTAGQPGALATIQQLDPIFVDFTQSSVDRLKLIQGIKSGRLKKEGADQSQVKLVLEDGTVYPQEGTLKFSDVTVDPNTGSVALRALFPNPDQLLLPGMFVRGKVQEGVRDNAILVPQRGVTRTPAGDAMVMVVGSEEKVETRIIKVERTVGSDWLVEEGLQAGDRVILEGTQKARPGTPVKAVPFGSQPKGSGGAPQSQSSGGKK